jgi:hypothetical protein
MEDSEWEAMHLESHNTFRDECELCLGGDGLIIICLDNDKGMLLVHESEIEKVKNE